MDKKALQTYAVWAKNNLENQIEVALKSLGINSVFDIKEAKRVGEYTIIDGDMNSYPADMFEKRNRIIDLIRKDGYHQTIEEFAYTWFNRIVALRFMEVHDFLPHGFRVLSSRDGGVEPEIMKNINFVKDDLHIDMSIVEPLISQGKTDEAFRYVLFRQCKALSGILPMLFQKDYDYLELLLPKALLKGETFITKLVELGEEPFLNDIEVIGWLYQFYISQKKDAVFASKETITKDTLPAVTQLFTPDWIVKYMAENSVGRIWLESYPSSSLRSQMKYYVEDAKQEEDVQKKIDEIQYKNVNPEEIRVIEPCCGSGHILVYVFDLLYKMYEEKGYQPREIPTLILKKNIVGLDVDKRAAQLASFSLIMKARTMNSRFFNDSYYTIPEVYEIWDSKLLTSLNYKATIEETHLLNADQIKNIEWLVGKFDNAKTIGSLLKVEKKDFEAIRASIQTLKDKMVPNIFTNRFFHDGIACLNYLLKLAEILSSKYDVMITNPPYIGTSAMESDVRKYAASNYPDSKTDMSAMFMETDFVKKNGFITMINMHSWMFLSSYEQLRKKISSRKMIQNMVHLGARAFEMIGGEVVQTTSFVIRNSAILPIGIYFRLVDEKDKETAFLTQKEKKINFSQKALHKMPGSPISYWISSKMVSHFSDKNYKFYDAVKFVSGNKTANNDVFLRFRWEISKPLINEVFFTCAKGGLYRKWYGNSDYVINWSDEAKKYYKKNGNLLDPSYEFKSGITYTDLTTKGFNARVLDSKTIPDMAGPALILPDEKRCSLLALLNSTVATNYFSLLNSTLHYKLNDVKRVPVVYDEDKTSEINVLVKDCVRQSKNDWDSFEVSSDFKKHPLI